MGKNTIYRKSLSVLEKDLVHVDQYIKVNQMIRRYRREVAWEGGRVYRFKSMNIVVITFEIKFKNWNGKLEDQMYRFTKMLSNITTRRLRRPVRIRINRIDVSYLLHSLKWFQWFVPKTFPMCLHSHNLFSLHDQNFLCVRG